MERIACPSSPEHSVARLIAHILAPLAPSGCISTQKQALSEDTEIRDIRVDPEVAVFEEMYYVGPSLGADINAIVRDAVERRRRDDAK